MNEFKQIVTVVAYGIEGFGVLVILIGCGIATARLVSQYRSRPAAEVYHEYRQFIGRSIILGLEFLIAGDIIRTVIVEPTLDNVIVLGIIVIICTFLSMTLHLEIEGRWPWQAQQNN